MIIIPNAFSSASSASSGSAPSRGRSAGAASGSPEGGASASAAGDFFGSPAGAVGVQENSGPSGAKLSGAKAVGAKSGNPWEQDSETESQSFLAALGSAVLAFQQELNGQAGAQDCECPAAPKPGVAANAARQFAIVRQIPSAQDGGQPANAAGESKEALSEAIPSIELPSVGENPAAAEGAQPVARVIDLGGVQISEIMKSIGDPQLATGEGATSIPDPAGAAQPPVAFADLIARLRALADEAREILGEAVDTALEAIDGGAGAGDAIAEAPSIEGALAANPRARELPIAAIGAEPEDSLEADFDGGADAAQASEIFTSAARGNSGEAAGVHEAGFAHQLSEAADFLATRLDGAIRAGQNGMEAELRLNPPDLGRVKVELQMSADGAIQTHFTVQRAETGALIQQNARHFTETLGAQGLSVERVQVTVEGAERSNTENRLGERGNGRDRHPAFERFNDGRGRNGKPDAFELWQQAAQA